MNVFFIVSAVLTGVLICLMVLVLVFRKKIIIKKLLFDAQRGDVSSSLALSGYYLSSKPADITNGLIWLTKAANGGSAEAQTALGTIYGDGRLVPQNKEEALKRFLEGAMNGSVLAQKTIAGVYHFSVGLDKKIAYAWYNVAALSGDKHAKEMSEKLSVEFDDKDKIIAANLALEYVKNYYKPKNQ